MQLTVAIWVQILRVSANVKVLVLRLKVYAGAIHARRVDLLVSQLELPLLLSDKVELRLARHTIVQALGSTGLALVHLRRQPFVRVLLDGQVAEDVELLVLLLLHPLLVLLEDVIQLLEKLLVVLDLARLFTYRAYLRAHPSGRGERPVFETVAGLERGGPAKG